MKSLKKSSFILLLVSFIVLCLCGCSNETGSSPAAASNTVNVSNIDELLAAIAPDAEIHLAPGRYYLTEAADYGKDSANKYYHWNSFGFDGEYELCLESVDGLHLVGDNAELLTVPRSSNVLRFRNCDNLSLQGLTVGHTEASEACQGGVIYMEYCANASIDRCALYGCGTIGVWTESCSDLMVTDTDIYHCSSAGISFSDGIHLNVAGCRIYDCGQSGAYQEATAALLFYNASDITVSGCEVYDNYLQTLVSGYANNASFDGLQVSRNHIKFALSCDGELNFTNLNFMDNRIDAWNGMYLNITATLDGEPLTEERLSELWGEQLSSAGVGTTDAEYLTADRSGTTEVHVSTPDEFLAAIASDTTVYIDVPRIDLTASSSYGEGAPAESWDAPVFNGRAYVWGSCYDGYQLFIGDVRNFHIVGGEIVTQPRYANVLNLLSCADITLENVRLGHTPEQGICMGGVMYLNQSENILLEGCDLYGCGTLGIETMNVRNLQVQNTLIHDCSSGAALLQLTEGAVFLGCNVQNCPTPHFSLRECSCFSWDNTLMDPYSDFNVNDQEWNPYADIAVYDYIPNAPDTSDRGIAASVLCIVADAYFKGDEDTISGYLAKTWEQYNPKGIPTDSKAVFFITTGYNLITSSDSIPADLVKDTSFIIGLDDIAENEPDGTVHKMWIRYTDDLNVLVIDPQQLYVELIREDGTWRVQAIQ